MNKYLLSQAIVCIFITNLAFAYDHIKTHPELTKYAVENATETEKCLKEQLGFTNGYKQKLDNGHGSQTIIDWLKTGSREEDEPSCRAANHFHDPLKPWTSSELTDPVWIVDRFCEATTKFRTKYSNISWATGIKNPAGELMSENINGTGDGAVNGRNWFVARELYYNALTTTDSGQREAFFAKTFHTLGYVLHLLEDMAVPAHTRNDFSEGHAQNIGCPDGKPCLKDWIGNPYEGYVRDYFEDEIFPIISANISTPFSGTKTLTNFWDTETYNQDDIPTAATSQGLAEYVTGSGLTNGYFHNNLN